jgi:hypothetical protein
MDARDSLSEDGQNGVVTPDPDWLREHRAILGLVRAMRQAGTDAEFPPWMIVTPDDVLVDLPYTPPCRHLKPHTTRPVETEEALANYLTFKQLGWERAGYCWHYVPAFLHEWFGCGPDQELFIRA